MVIGRSIAACLLAGVFALCGGVPARGEPAPPVPAEGGTPALRVFDETAPVPLRDSRGARVTLRVPLALHRGANAFRLYGPRPLTLWERGHRRNLYRDAFLELATRSRLTTPGSVAQPAGAGGEETAAGWLDSAKAAFREPAGLSGPHAEALLRALGASRAELLASDPVAEALRLRALATDAAHRRLLALGAVIEGAPGVDPALREGYRAAVAEFEEVRRGLWPAVGALARRQRGLLLLQALRQLLLSRLGAWAIFGELVWQGAESALRAEHRGQLAVCLATAAAHLAEAAARAPEVRPLALYAEFALSYQLTEALKTGQVMALKPAGGRRAGEWQIRLSERCELLRRALLAGARPAETSAAAP